MMNRRQDYSIGRTSHPDFRLLHIFCTIVDSGGFTQAQEVMNVALSSISTAMNDLETRLGVTLCTRGRGGFALTAAGESIYQQALQLFAEADTFNQHVAQLKGKLTGELHIGIVDNSTIDPVTRIPDIIHRFSEAHPDVHIGIKVLTSAEIEAELLEGSLNLGIGLFANHKQQLKTLVTFPVQVDLHCGKGSLLFDKEDLQPEEVFSTGYAKSFYSPPVHHSITKQLPLPTASCYQSEGLAYLIMSGRYLGFLPTRYAATWVAQRELQVVLPEYFRHEISMSLVVHRGNTSDRMTTAFLKAFQGYTM